MAFTRTVGAIADCEAPELLGCEIVSEPGRSWRITTRRWVISLVIAKRRAKKGA